MVTHQLQVERRTGKVRQSETDVLPLCHATNSAIGSMRKHPLGTGVMPPELGPNKFQERPSDASRIQENLLAAGMRWGIFYRIVADPNLTAFSLNLPLTQIGGFPLPTFSFKHQRQRAQATCMPVRSSTMNMYMLDNETR